MNDSDRIPAQEFAPAEVSELDLYEKREKIYTRRMEGFFQKVRLFTGWPLLLGYFLLPWFDWGHRQSVLFDLPARQFSILGLTFWPQDFPLLAWLLIIGAFSLFAVTAVAGRVWCGYTCPQTVWTSIFMWAEQLAEGSRNQRIKLDRAPWSLQKVARKVAKHGMWLGFAAATGITFVGYFVPIRELVVHLFTLKAGFWEWAWTIFFTCATYINAGWMREQVCKFMCPYARFQSAMFDTNTLIVSYDPNRGEPRGSRRRDAERGADGLGDCIDCQLCVQVCPTGIDIRNGLQYECIGCALCVDACNSVMDKMHYPRGLIRYTTENELEGKPTRLLRPRLFFYAALILIMAGLFTYTLATRIPLRVDILRDRNQLYTMDSEGMVDNTYTLKIMNMDQHMHEYRVSVKSPEPVQIVGTRDVVVDSGEVYTLPLRLRADPGEMKTSNSSLTFVVTDVHDKSITASQVSRFIGPAVR